MKPEILPTPDLFKNVKAIIMAGGESQRMGTDKSQLPIGERPMIEYVLNQLRPYFQQICISANDIERYASLGVEIVPDRIPGKGPVMGLISVINASDQDLNFVQACDIPETDISLVAKMLKSAEGYDAVVPQTPDGYVEPLFAVYRKSALKSMEHVLKHEHGKASRIVAHCRARLIDLESSDHLRNLNTIVDYQSFLKRRS
ncbi:MAG: molybdenum cofactor guanylyltransferase [Proteobacteria bacterium]|nr:molybdenum cofactor guanylyltransferase [Pseudomonadota bacterium]